MQVLGLNGNDPPEDLNVFLDAFQVSFPVLVEAQATYTQYRQTGATSPFPLDYVIDQAGNVAYYSTEYDPEAITAVVDQLLGNTPAIATDPTTYSFGAVPVGGNTQLLLTVSNSGNGDLQISSIATGTPHFSVNITSLLVPPGSQRTPVVTFAPQVEDWLLDDLTLTSNDPVQPQKTVPLHGVGGTGVGVGEFGPTLRLAAAPNPFAPRTEFQFVLAQAGPTWLAVYDLQGRAVRHLLRGQDLPAGAHHLPWDGRRDNGRPLAAGIYFSRLRSGKQVITHKITLLR